MDPMGAMAVLIVMVENNVKNIQRLVRSFTASSSTAELIILVAADKELLALSRVLVGQVDRGQTSKLTEDVGKMCDKEGVLIAVFYSEVRKVLQALQLQQDTPQREEYRILGLEPGATREEIKKAYRELSIRYHPDRAGDSQGAKDKFIRINEAYRSLEKEDAIVSFQPVTNWRKGSRRRRDKGKQTRFIVTIAIIVLVLVLLSIFYAWQYREKVYRQQILEIAGSLPGGASFDSKKDTSITALTGVSTNLQIVASCRVCTVFWS